MNECHLISVTWLPGGVADHDSQNLELVFSAVCLVRDGHCDGAVRVLRYPDAGQEGLALLEFMVSVDCFQVAFASGCTALGEKKGLSGDHP